MVTRRWLDGVKVVTINGSFVVEVSLQIMQVRKAAWS